VRRSYRRRIAFGAALVTAITVLFAGAGRAHAYVRTVTSGTAHPMCWPRPDLHLNLAAGVSLPDLDSAAFIAAAQAAAAAWNEASLTPEGRCTQLQLIIDVTADARADATKDEHNWITFRQDMWRRQPCEPTPEDDCRPYDASVLAVTSTYARSNNGTIVGGDIEINGTVRWADLVAEPALRANRYDLQNALTHELGHFIGLDHTCYLPSKRPRPIDNQGDPVPDCGADSSAAIMATTMYASSQVGDIGKRDLSEDDVRAVCDLFPAGGRLSCAPDATGGDSGCTFAGRSDARGVWGLALALAALVIARRHRRSS
jgi:hypothetical protein